MSQKIAAGEVKQAAQRLAARVEFSWPATAWRFAAPPEGSISPAARAWTCMYALMAGMQSGQPLSFSAAACGCPGAANYLGFRRLPSQGAAFFLAGKERYKKDFTLAEAFYNAVEAPAAREENLVFERLEFCPDTANVEVVNLWIGAAALSALLTLANYDRASNDNVMVPFASGCQSLWTLPLKENARELPKAVLGSLDPSVQHYLPAGTLSFSLPARRLLELADNVESSYLGKMR